MADGAVERSVIDKHVTAVGISVDYQPFGVKTLKLRVERNQTMKPKVPHAVC